MKICDILIATFDKLNCKGIYMIVDTFNRTYHREVEGDRERVDFVRGSNVRMWKNDISRSFECHWHSAVEIVAPITNIYTLVIHDVKYVLRPGDIIVIPSGELHETIAPEEGERYICLFDLDCVSKIKSFSSFLPFFTSAVLINKNNAPDTITKYLDCIDRMAEIYFTEEPMWELRMYSEILYFFAILGQDRMDKLMTAPSKSDYKQSEYMNKFNSLFTYIDSHYFEDITLEYAAELTGYSKFHFTRLFKQFANTTFYDYLCYKRIKVAEELLINPSLKITDVSIRCGFPSISTFNRMFKKLKNCTPSEYRELRERNTFEKVYNVPEDEPITFKGYVKPDEA